MFKKNLLLYLIYFFSVSIGFAQSQKLDSLYVEAEKCYKNENYLTAFNLYFKLANELNSNKIVSSKKGYVFMNLGNCYEYFNYDKEAKQSLNKAISIFKSTKNFNGEAYSLCFLGDILEDEGKISEAKNGYKRAFDLFSLTKNEIGKAQLFDNIASIFENQEKYDSAIFYLNKALTIYQIKNDSLGLAKVLNNLGDVNRRNKNYQLSLKFYQNSLAISKAIGSKKEENGNLKDISKTYSKLKMYEKAYNSYTKYHESYHKLKVENKISEIARLQLDNINETKNIEISALETKNSLQTQILTLLIIGLVLLLIILILIYFTFKIKRTKDTQLALMKQNLLKVELKSNQLVNEALNKELEIKKNKLSDFTKTLIERSEIITELKSQLEKSLVNEKISDESREKALTDLSDASLLTNQDWRKFKKRFEDVYPDFFQNLSVSYPLLTIGDQRLVAVMKLNLDKDEMAAMMGISEESVKKAKQRLRKKISEEPDFNLKNWVTNL